MVPVPVRSLFTVPFSRMCLRRPCAVGCIIGISRRYLPDLYVIAPFGHTAVQSKHTTQRLGFTIFSGSFIHSALHTRSHSPQLMQRSGSISIWNSGLDAVYPRIVPTGHTELHSRRPRRHDKATTATAVSAAIASDESVKANAPRSSPNGRATKSSTILAYALYGSNTVGRMLKPLIIVANATIRNTMRVRVAGGE